MIFEVAKRWKDDCNHPPEAYVGSFECLGETFDLYVFDSKWDGQEVCIRFGDEGSHYFSPGPLVSFIKSAHMMLHYQDALEMLLAKGKFSWTKNKE